MNDHAISIVLKDQVFCLRDVDGAPVYMIVCNNKIIGDWPDKGTALAGLATEQRRVLDKNEPKPDRLAEILGR